MHRAKNGDTPVATASIQLSPLHPEDERKAASISGLGGAFLRESGFSLIEVGSNHATYRNGNGHQIKIQGHRWFCKPSNGDEFSGVGFVDLEDVIRGG
jgi:hypothetical protein